MLRQYMSLHGTTVCNESSRMIFMIRISLSENATLLTSRTRTPNTYFSVLLKQTLIDLTAILTPQCTDTLVIKRDLLNPSLVRYCISNEIIDEHNRKTQPLNLHHKFPLLELFTQSKDSAVKFPPRTLTLKRKLIFTSPEIHSTASKQSC